MTRNADVHAADGAPELAKIFLMEHPEVWHPWVSEDPAKKVDASLQG
jgi:ABC-type proline/glycine betaine transport system substrate-binding protein